MRYRVAGWGGDFERFLGISKTHSSGGGLAVVVGLVVVVTKEVTPVVVRTEVDELGLELVADDVRTDEVMVVGTDEVGVMTGGRVLVVLTVDDVAGTHWSSTSHQQPLA
jgi:hypothetical protein